MTLNWLFSSSRSLPQHSWDASRPLMSSSVPWARENNPSRRAVCADDSVAEMGS